MKYVVMFLEVHQPRRLRRYRMQDIGKFHDYFWDEYNSKIMERIARNCYIPTLKIFLENEIKVNLSLTGVFIEQAKEFTPYVMDQFKEYIGSGLAELLGETYYHSLASIWSENEFYEQVQMHLELLKREFNTIPESFRNTELIYNDNIGRMVKKMGFKRILAEGKDEIIEKHSPNYIYRSPDNLSLFLRNYRLSDDISFRFSNWKWSEYPLKADKYAKWIDLTPGDVANIFMDFETFGEHQVAETGIFEFLKYLPKELGKRGIEMVTLREADEIIQKREELSIKDTISWADTRRDLSPWLGNEMQREAFNELIKLERRDHVWRNLQTSDHLYYMSTGISQDIEVHEYFNPYKSPYVAFLNFMNVLNDMKHYQKNLYR